MIAASSQESMAGKPWRRRHLLALDGGKERRPRSLAVPGLEPTLIRIVKEYMNEQPGYSTPLRSLMTELLLLVVRNRLADRPRSAEQGKIEPR